VAGAGITTLLAGCDRIASDAGVNNVLGKAENVSRRIQGLVTPRQALAREFTEADISRVFKSNGTSDPDDDEYQAFAGNNFADWRLDIGGLVGRPMKLSLADLRGMPSRTQITRHDCVEGWSCIGKWKGTVLSDVLRHVGLQPGARYLVFYCADPMDMLISSAQNKYYESIDLGDAFHPQTILAYEMNNQPLPIPYGAPVRLRVERQLGYKMAKYVMRIEAVESFAHIGGGKGGYWEDQGYAWYAGI
jgi:DMSO/TMAO reductase YedYZ molybdopterin-dependent catalytic subunit